MSICVLGIQVDMCTRYTWVYVYFDGIGLYT